MFKFEIVIFISERRFQRNGKSRMCAKTEQQLFVARVSNRIGNDNCTINQCVFYFQLEIKWKHFQTFFVSIKCEFCLMITGFDRMKIPVSCKTMSWQLVSLSIIRISIVLQCPDHRKEY